MIISASLSLDTADMALSLERYAQLIGFSECAIYGVNNPGKNYNDCDNKIWTLSQRVLAVKYLREAQDEIEQVVGYPLAPRWIAAEQHPLYSACMTKVVHAKYGKLIAAGQKAETVIDAGAAVNHAADPAVVTVATTVTDTDEIRVFHPGSDLEINPSAISIAGGNATISIPRCRMVKESEMDNDAAGLDYSDTTLFESTVDVKRIYNDDSVNAELVYMHRDSDSSCDCECGCASCGETTKDACLYMRNPVTGAFDVQRADYSGGAWGAVCTRCYGTPDAVRLYYRAGMTPLSYQAEDCIVRLAHAKMPSAPCGCDILQQMWAQDTKIPEVLSTERLACPFGLSQGAWIAWKFANAMKLWRAGAI